MERCVTFTEKISFLENKLNQYLARSELANFYLGNGIPSDIVLIGRIMTHLTETAKILENKGASDYLVDAGLFHSIYGEKSSRSMPKNIYLTREELADVIGHEAEKIVYVFSEIPSPRSKHIRNMPECQLKQDLIMLDEANSEQMNSKVAI